MIPSTLKVFIEEPSQTGGIEVAALQRPRLKQNAQD